MLAAHRRSPICPPASALGTRRSRGGGRPSVARRRSTPTSPRAPARSTRSPSPARGARRELRSRRSPAPGGLGRLHALGVEAVGGSARACRSRRSRGRRRPRPLGGRGRGGRHAYGCAANPLMRPACCGATDAAVAARKRSATPSADTYPPYLQGGTSASLLCLQRDTAPCGVGERGRERAARISAEAEGPLDLQASDFRAARFQARGSPPRSAPSVAVAHRLRRRRARSARPRPRRCSRPSQTASGTVAAL